MGRLGSLVESGSGKESRKGGGWPSGSSGSPVERGSGGVEGGGWPTRRLGNLVETMSGMGQTPTRDNSMTVN